MASARAVDMHGSQFVGPSINDADCQGYATDASWRTASLPRPSMLHLHREASGHLQRGTLGQASVLGGGASADAAADGLPVTRQHVGTATDLVREACPHLPVTCSGRQLQSTPSDPSDREAPCFATPATACNVTSGPGPCEALTLLQQCVSDEADRSSGHG